MESVVDKYRRMALAEEEDDLDLDDTEEGEVPKEESKPGFPVVGVLLTDRKIRFPVIKEMMASLWRPGKGLPVKEVGEKRHLFTFYHRLDMNRVLDGGPWQFEKILLLLKVVRPDDIPHKIVLNEADFWVQVHNVPYSLVNLGTAGKVGNLIGRFIKYDDNQNSDKWEAYMRIHVCMNVEKVLKRGTNLKKDGKSYWVDFKYEKLPNFCFICGQIGHSDKFCHLIYDEDLVMEKKFEVHLRAGSGGKTSPTGGNQTLLEGSSSSGRDHRYGEGAKSEDRMRDGRKDLGAESE
ncbi:unnamed protein product [Cuscuta europaea]|uniref:CCHC-type domain-containing protein n=1 Tax=Cuscuta europaea TaxID=41803 RepID=A0A9P0Z343_CUSEU|nr:unnamed protein product [Cuscuta europaea]